MKNVGAYSNNGSVLFFAVIAVVILSALGYAYLYISQLDRLFFIRNRDRAEAFAAAEAGIEVAKSWLPTVSINAEWHPGNWVRNPGSSSPANKDQLVLPIRENGNEWIRLSEWRDANNNLSRTSAYRLEVTPVTDDPWVQDFRIISTGRLTTPHRVYEKPVIAEIRLNTSWIPSTWMPPENNDDFFQSNDAKEHHYAPVMNIVRSGSNLLDRITGITWQHGYKNRSYPWTFICTCEEDCRESHYSGSYENPSPCNSCGVYCCHSTDNWCVQGETGVRAGSLPTVQELVSIIDYSNIGRTRRLFGLEEDDNGILRYWTDTEQPNNSSRQVVVNMYDGSISTIARTPHRCGFNVAANEWRYEGVTAQLLLIDKPSVLAYPDNQDPVIQNYVSVGSARWGEADSLLSDSSGEDEMYMRLPDKKELVALWGELGGGTYWSSTRGPGTDNRWVVDFTNGTSSVKSLGETHRVAGVSGANIEVLSWKEEPVDIKALP